MEIGTKVGNFKLNFNYLGVFRFNLTFYFLVSSAEILVFSLRTPFEIIIISYKTTQLSFGELAQFVTKNTCSGF
jgi:hypothetical protein